MSATAQQRRTKKANQDPWWLDEERMSYSALARKIGVHHRTVAGWIRRGILHRVRRTRIKLEGYSLGAAVYTTWEAYLRFDEKVNDD